MLHDRFHARWDQPISLLEGGETFSTVVEIRIAPSGAISGVSMTRSSGNTAMDDSVMMAARRVTQVDRIPPGLGDASGYKVNIEFKLSP
ncbi:MAG TPA: TonB family protein [Chthoniobacteraceae bacterium]|nr:TonB family protein [Chthoniobacteraceae bacterium]